MTGFFGNIFGRKRTTNPEVFYINILQEKKGIEEFLTYARGHLPRRGEQPTNYHYDLIGVTVGQIILRLEALRDMVGNFQVYMNLKGEPAYANVRNVQGISTFLENGFRALTKKINEEYLPLAKSVGKKAREQKDWEGTLGQFSILSELMEGKQGLSNHLNKLVTRGRQIRTRAA